MGKQWNEYSHQEKLERFVRRARRIGAHSLAQDPETLAPFATGTLGIVLDECDEGSVFLVRPLPESEEILESFGARLRPVTMEKESVWIPGILDAIDALVVGQTRPDFMDEYLSEVRKRFAEVYSSAEMPRHLIFHTTPTGEKEMGEATSAELGLSWLYGESVHHDPLKKYDEALKHDLADRYYSAVVFIARMFNVVKIVLELIHSLEKGGYIHLDPDVWTNPVTIEVTEIRNKSDVFYADSLDGIDNPDEFEENFTLLSPESLRGFGITPTNSPRPPVE